MIPGNMCSSVNLTLILSSATEAYCCFHVLESPAGLRFECEDK